MQILRDEKVYKYSLYFEKLDLVINLTIGKYLNVKNAATASRHSVTGNLLTRTLRHSESPSDTVSHRGSQWITAGHGGHRGSQWSPCVGDWRQRSPKQLLSHATTTQVCLPQTQPQIPHPTQTPHPKPRHFYSVVPPFDRVRTEAVS